MPPSTRCGIPREADEPAPRPRPDDRTELALAEEVRQRVPARARVGIHEHRLRAVVGEAGRREPFESAARPERERLPREVLDHAVRDESAAVVPLVDEERGLARLRVEELLEHPVAGPRRVREMQVADLSARQPVDHRHAALHPVEVAQVLLGRDRLDEDRPRAFRGRPVRHEERDDLPALALEKAVRIVRRRQVVPVDREEELPSFTSTPGSVSGERHASSQFSPGKTFAMR